VGLGIKGSPDPITKPKGGIPPREPGGENCSTRKKRKKDYCNYLKPMCRRSPELHAYFHRKKLKLLRSRARGVSAGGIRDCHDRGEGKTGGI